MRFSCLTSLTFSGLLRAVFFASFLVMTFPMSAQRTATGQYYVGAEAGTCVMGDRGFAMDVQFGQYLLKSKWDVGINYMYRVYDVGYNQFLARGTWQYRLISTRSRVFNFYGGAGVHMGYEYIPPRMVTEVPEVGSGSGSVSVDISQQTSNGEQKKFLYGMHVGAEAEWFIVRKMALVLGLRLPLVFNSYYGAYGLTMNPAFNICVGVRFNI